MTSERYEQVKESLAEALALDRADRAAYLARLLARDRALHDEVSQLLTYSRRADAFLEDPAVPQEAIATGSSFGGYEIESALGRGGMGQVYLARERTLDRPVALKFLSPELQAREDARHRFLREARAAAALDHPYVCKIFQTGEEGGRPFIAMEYVRGETLKDRLARERLGLDETLQIVQKVAEALEAAHTAHIVHRDLKPSNVMLTPGGHVKVLDFGLAKRIGPDDADASAVTLATQTGVVQGTIAYMSPEQLRGEEVDSRSDIFSLGILLYEMAAGTHPFRGEIAADTPGLILRHEPPPLSARAAGVPPSLDQVARRMLAKDRNARYQSVSDLRTDLLDTLDASRTRPLTPERQAAAWWHQPRGRRLALAALVLAVVAGAGGLWPMLRQEEPAPAAEEPFLLAVLPFVNDTNDPDNDYLASGVAENVLARLKGAGYQVLPWATSSRFPGDSDPEEAARALGADAVLSGTLRADARTIQVTPSLVRRAGNRYELAWTDPLQEPFDSNDGLLNIMTRLAQGVAGRLGQQLTPERAEALARAESTSSDALDLYMQGAALVLQGGRQELDAAPGWFEGALEDDPNFVQAHVGLGTVYYQQFWSGWGTLDDLLQAVDRFERALDLDPKNMRALRGLMAVEFARGRSEAILDLGMRAAGGDPQDVETRMAVAQALMLAGVAETADGPLRVVMSLDPSGAFAPYHLALNASYVQSGDPEAIDYYLREFGDDPYLAALAAFLYERNGEATLARDRYERSIGRLVKTPVETASADWFELSALLYAGMYYERLGQRDSATELWGKGVALVEALAPSVTDNFKAHALLAAFHAFLGAEPAFRQEAGRAMEILRGTPEVSHPWDEVYLAAAYARIGEMPAALRILREQSEGLAIAQAHLWPLFGRERWDSQELVEVRRLIRSRQRELQDRYAPLLSF